MKFIGYDGEIELEGATVKIKKGKKDTRSGFPMLFPQRSSSPV